MIDSIDDATGHRPIDDALLAATTHGHHGCVKWLLEAGANANATDLNVHDGQPPLILAISHTNAELARLLLDHGARPAKT